MSKNITGRASAIVMFHLTLVSCDSSVLSLAGHRRDLTRIKSQSNLDVGNFL